MFLSFLEDYDDPYDFESLKKALAETLDFLIVTGLDHGNTKPIKLKLILVDQDRMLAVNYGAGENGELKLTGHLESYREAPIDSPEFLKSTLLEPLYIRAGTLCDKRTGHYDCLLYTSPSPRDRG